MLTCCIYLLCTGFLSANGEMNGNLCFLLLFCTLKQRLQRTLLTRGHDILELVAENIKSISEVTIYILYFGSIGSY